MLYFAALSIVLDLLDPGKLRERGGGLKARAIDAPLPVKMDRGSKQA